MNNKLIYIIGGILVIGGIYLFLNSNESVSNPLDEKVSENNKNVVYKENEKKIKISQEYKENTSFNKNISEINKNQINHINNNVVLQEVEVKRDNVNTFVSNENKKISKFIDENDLNPVEKVGDVEIFAKNPPQKNEFAPPMPPTLIKVKFKNSSKIIPLKSDLINSNKKIYVVKKEGDKYSEIKAIDTKKLTSFTPPSIGQN